MILDVCIRYLRGWMLAHAGNGTLAEALLADTVAKQRIGPGRLTIHVDRGSPMTADLGVTTSHSMPHVSNANPFSESQFRTLTYRPEFPARFGRFEDAHAHCKRFPSWYNDEHRHSSIGFHTPADVHDDRATLIRGQRAVCRRPRRRLRPAPRTRRPQTIRTPAAIHRGVDQRTERGHRHNTAIPHETCSKRLTGAVAVTPPP